MKRRKVSPFFALGIGLILCSLCLLLVSRIRMYVGSRESKTVVSQIDGLLPERTPGIPGNYLDSCMPVLEIDGKDYVAILEIPAFGITLPVADQWEGKKLYAAPSRFYGSVYDCTLVIGGADSSGQFAFCDKIENGSHITITDMTGARFMYSVSCVERAKRAETQWLLDTDCDLTLFCRDAYTMEYIAVRCASSFR